MSTKVRVRFAPSPTGFMHLGNVRAALLNYIFAKQNNGSFILRIEDTDESRNTQESFKAILEDLSWLKLTHDEGPQKGGLYGPYLQSQRKKLYEDKLIELVSMSRAYRCFCSSERLEKMREQQRAMKKPPRYDRTCLNLSSECIAQKMDSNQPFIWRFKINEHQTLTLHKLSGQQQTFEMKHFGDFTIARQDGSFTFVFTNAIDDILMEISHVIRGEDHISNTALQLAIYDALALQAPRFLHLSMMCNEQGEKMSKRDFGFALQDLKVAGFTPQAICNYLCIIGTSVKEEVQSIKELIKHCAFNHYPSENAIVIPEGGTIKYDIEKLRWINQQWIKKLPLDQLITYLKPLLFERLPESRLLSDSKLAHLTSLIISELKTLNDALPLFECYLHDPKISYKDFTVTIGEHHKQVETVLKANFSLITNPQALIERLKIEGKKEGIGLKPLFSSIRYILTGSTQGMGINELLEFLGTNIIEKRFEYFFRLID